MLTADDFFKWTGVPAPADFDVCVVYAENLLHEYTLHAYVGRNMADMPSRIRNAWDQALAIQTLAISQQGGVAGSSESSPTSMSLGKFSYSGDSSGAVASAAGGISPGAKALLPLLVAYGRGLQKEATCPCAPFR